MGLLDELNDRQYEAATHVDGPLLIIAGAGSGKTKAITHRIAYLIKEAGVDPYNIMAITFTNKAAGEMRERVDRIVGAGSEGVWVMTFHSSCVRILRRHRKIDIFPSRSFTVFPVIDIQDAVERKRDLILSLRTGNTDLPDAAARDPKKMHCFLLMPPEHPHPSVHNRIQSAPDTENICPCSFRRVSCDRDLPARTVIGIPPDGHDICRKIRERQCKCDFIWRFIHHGSLEQHSVPGQCFPLPGDKPSLSLLSLLLLPEPLLFFLPFLLLFFL